MNTYLALLRGINVGGNSLIKMSDLKISLSNAGLEAVQTYIQSGNVIFKSKLKDTDRLASVIKTAIRQQFGLNVDVAVFSATEWQAIIKATPAWWGKDATWKHNLLIMIKPYVMDDVVAAIGELKPGVEATKTGNGVIYQSAALSMVGRAATGSKLISNRIYKQMTIRNYNTATKLLTFFE